MTWGLYQLMITAVVVLVTCYMAGILTGWAIWGRKRNVF